MSEFLQHLRERKLVQWALAYLAGAWVMLQVCGLIGQQFDWPAALLRGITVAAAIGFFIVLVLAWYHGERGSQRVGGTELLLLAAVLAIGGVILWRVAPAGRAPDAAGAPNAAHAGATQVSDKSIAVLPFENLSDDRANAYFAEGIQDEILTRLARIRALKVISRTSTQQYAAKPGNLREIAQQLGVANVLEGSVQKSGDNVHIIVQLIRAATDEHLWAESFNRRLDDIFAVEAEVAQTVADTLKTQLSGAEAEQLAATPTHNAAAYDAYLLGLALMNRPSGGAIKTQLDAITAFEHAVQLDPEFAAGWARLCYAHSFVYFASDASNAHRDAARHAMEVAQRLSPDATDTLMAHGYYRYWVERDYKAAKAIFEQARARLPNASEPPSALAAIARREGRWRESMALFAQALALDPRDPGLVGEALQTALAVRDYAVAGSLVERARAIAPADPYTALGQVMFLLMQGQLEAAQRVLDGVAIPSGDWVFLAVVVNNAVYLRRYAPGLALLDSALADSARTRDFDGILLLLRADLHRLAGDATEARASYVESRTAIEALISAGRQYDWIPGMLSQVEAGLGNKAAAIARAQEAVARLPATTDALFGPGNEEQLARVHARFGDKNEAIAILQRLLVTPYNAPVTVATLKLDPDWDALRDDWRFQELLRMHEASGEDASHG